MKEESEDILTETLADVYLGQGMKIRARRIFEKLLKRDPQNERVRMKLKSLDSSPVEDAKDLMCEEERSLDQGGMGDADLQEAGGGEDLGEMPLDFQQLDDLYGRMNREKIARKVKMLKGLLEHLRA